MDQLIIPPLPDGLSDARRDINVHAVTLQISDAVYELKA